MRNDDESILALPRIKFDVLLTFALKFKNAGLVLLAASVNFSPG